MTGGSSLGVRKWERMSFCLIQGLIWGRGWCFVVGSDVSFGWRPSVKLGGGILDRRIRGFGSVFGISQYLSSG